MAGCTSPLYRVSIGSSNFKHLLPMDQKRLRNHGVFLKLSDLASYEQLPSWDPDQVQKIRCGQCASCRLATSFDWAVRCSFEAEAHEHNYFVTLTYDDAHLPSGEFVDYSGMVWDSNLERRHVQLFVKNLREYERTHYGNTSIKVFYCGEYGDLNGRPHYHICLFGVSEIPDLTLYQKRGNFSYYKSVLYEGFWSSSDTGVKVPRGFVDISELSFDTVAYTARYCMKKQRGLMKKEFLSSYDALDPVLRPAIRTQPFIGMSLKPGIASEYYKEHRLQIYSEDLVKYKRKFKLFKSKPPRYFDKLFDREFPEAFSQVKRKRLAGSLAADKMKFKLTDASRAGRLLQEALINEEKGKRRYVRSL